MAERDEPSEASWEISKANRIQLYVAKHRLIYEAIVSGDEEAAAFYVENHLKRVQRGINTRE
ncbi:hypothetical protein [Pseudomonas chlororaphis]|jgi:DNA-binding FadR family transcriptional regulator